jgi:ATP-dependent exoDNAse (exonuclease V) beta subunit
VKSFWLLLAKQRLIRRTTRMSELLIDWQARERFCTEWQRNFAVSANAGSGKTTAISERLAAMALSSEGAAVLPKTAVVTYTKKAALQIGQRARQVLLRRIGEIGATDLSALDQLERAFFGTIHSFCLLLAQRYGQLLGLNLNPRLLVENEDEEEVFWEEFLEQDSMQFSVLAPQEMDAFLRFIALDEVFSVARSLNLTTARQLARRRPGGPLPEPSAEVLRQILELPVKGAPKARENTEANKRAAQAWMERFQKKGGFLPLYEPIGKAKAICDLAELWMSPLKGWLADAASVLAAELAGRYREYRFERGVQTYADQIDAAMTVLHDAETLDRIRADGWRVILDEAQDTDSQQFAVLVEIARPVGAARETWPTENGVPPRAGHFCMVGDAQQAIYRSRADIRNFTRHLEAFADGNGGELLVFQVTFRTPSNVISLLNGGFPDAFGREREHNLGLAAADGVVPPLLQVPYVLLEPGPKNGEGRAMLFPLTLPEEKPVGVKNWLVEEARQLAFFLSSYGPSSVGAERWSEVCLLAPRVDWLLIFQKEFERAGLKTALQIRRSRNGDSPVYAWLTGLLAVVCDPENTFEWFGVLREIFAVSDSMLALELREKGAFRWETPEQHPEPLCGALTAMRPWILRADDEGLPLGQFVQGLVNDCRLAEKAGALDTRGERLKELDRLLAWGTQLGLEGAGPRQWHRELLAGIEQQQPSGNPHNDAVNLLSAHSAKGLEWPVVIPVGFWHSISEPTPRGLYLVSDYGGQTRMFFDHSSLPPETSEARDRERIRELVRLLYVTLTRTQRSLVIPWLRGFGVRRGSGPSFADLWGSPEMFEALPCVEKVSRLLVLDPDPTIAPRSERKPPAAAENNRKLAPLPQRLLPHQLATKADLTRGLRHETALDQAMPSRLSAGDEAIDYGLWWHETMEFVPWRAKEEAIAEYWQGRLIEAQASGFAERAWAELQRLLSSVLWQELRSNQWELATEVAVLAPLEAGAWIDGVVDLVLHDQRARKLRVLDWKTNRQRQGESGRDLLQRLAREYAPQLRAYGLSLRKAIPGSEVQLMVYSSAAGDWMEVDQLA